MAFNNMPDLGPMLLPGANAYGREFTELARLAAESHAHELDIAYGPDSFQQLDVWMPAEKVEGGAPVLVFIHGGAFRNGHKEWIGAMASAITQMPAVLVSPNYRLVPRAKVPDAVDDCFDALAWVHRNIGRYGGNPDALFVGGHSAGAHLAAMLALRTELLDRRGIPQDAIRGCVPLSAVFSMKREEHAAASLVARFWDDMVGSQQTAHENTASTYAMRNTVPFYIAYGDNEPPEVEAGTEEMIRLARDNGFLFAANKFEGCDHFDAHRQTIGADDVWMRNLRGMVERYG